MVHFNWTQLVPGVTHDNVHVATSIAAAGAIGLLALAGRAALGAGDKAVIPAGRFSIKGVFEVIIDLMVALSDMVIGEHGRKFVPMFASVWFFIWASNLIGMIPGMTAATDNINTTLALGLCTFVVYNYYGVKENGWGYLKHFMGPVWWLAPMMLLIEFISHAIRPLTLGLRLAYNITADHTVLGIFLDIFPWGLPLPFYVMGLFVATLQAFVFTILSMVYVSMATAHEH